MLWSWKGTSLSGSASRSASHFHCVLGLTITFRELLGLKRESRTCSDELEPGSAQSLGLHSCTQSCAHHSSMGLSSS